MQDGTCEVPAPLSRRAFMRTIGLSGAALAAAPELLPRLVSGAPAQWQQAAIAGTVGPEQLHLQFGADAAREVVASWVTQGSVSRPRLRLGRDGDAPDHEVDAETRTYVDALSGTEVFTQHVALDDLEPGQRYVYEVLNDGAEPLSGSFTTARRGRHRFRFTSFGDQATPVSGDGLASPFAAYVVPQVESLQPAFHLLNGDLCYANISPDRVKTWRDFFTNNMQSARNRPWMPAAGNHENELGNGMGFGSYQTRFALPDNGEEAALRGLWYSFTYGSVRVISINNDDVCYQDGGDSCVHGYSQGRQKAWLQRELAGASRDALIDWIVVCMHQVAMSSASRFNGADLGIRQEWLPLFDQYGVDLVVCGHEHHYERTHPVRGVEQVPTLALTPGAPDVPTLTPRVVATDTDLIDTSKGTVHMVIGGGGTSAPSNALLYDPAKCDVIVGVGPQPSWNGTPPRPRRAPFKLTEQAAPWASVRDMQHSWGFAAFDVDPFAGQGRTRISVTFYDTAGSASGSPAPFDQFVLERPRRHSDDGGDQEGAG
jgi:3',5'-cyclic AMP phosphodiesterase CpdA